MKTVEQILEAYKTELRAYKKWTDEKKKHYGEKSSPLEVWDTGDFNRIMSWNDRLNGIEQTLGLSDKEIEDICKEVGVKINA